MTAIGYRLSAIGYRLSAIGWTVFPNAGDVRLSDIRHTLFPTARGFRRLRRPGSIVRVLRTERWVLPAERAGSEGSYKCCVSPA